MVSAPRTGRVVRSAMLLAAVLLLGHAAVASSVARAGVVITDTSMALDPSGGSLSTAFTATLTYTPRGELCPPAATTVSFTWDGYALGTSTMQTGASPCRATLSTKPLAGYTSAGTHQVCGTFQFQGAHKGCAPFKVAASNASTSGSSHPSSSPPKSQGGSTPTPGSVSSSQPAASRTSTSAPRSATPATTPAAAPPPKPRKDTGSGSLVGVAIGGLILLAALWLPVRNRLHRSN